MALYSIGEVAQLCDINPVTLRAWQRRYGLLKPQRTDGGHRLFNDADIDRIREIKASGPFVGRWRVIQESGAESVGPGPRAHGVRRAIKQAMTMAYATRPSKPARSS